MLRPGGVMLGCEAYPEEMGYTGVELALYQFSFEIGAAGSEGDYKSWTMVHQTLHMFYISKPL